MQGSFLMSKNEKVSGLNEMLYFFILLIKFVTTGVKLNFKFLNILLIVFNGFLLNNFIFQMSWSL